MSARDKSADEQSADELDGLMACESFEVEGIWQGSEPPPAMISGRAVKMSVESEGKIYHGWFVVERVEDE